MEIGVLVFFGLVGCGLWFAEETKVGRRLFDKLYDYFMKD